MAVGGLFVFSGCSDDDEPAPTKTIYELVSEDTNLSILKSQLDVGGFDATLNAAGTYTLFAPSNAAMNTLLQTLGLTDFSSISPGVVASVLSYHVLASQKLSGDLTAGDFATNQGESLTIAVTSTGEKKIESGATTDANITTADLKATNGVIHVVDAVLVPPTIGALIIQTLGTVAQPVLLSSSFTTLSAAIQKADAGKPAEQTIVGALVGLDDVTIFAPVNDVFAAASITVATYSAAEWDAIIRGHIVPASLATLSNGDVTTVNGKTITVATGTPNTVKGAGNSTPVAIVAAGVPANNGVLYPIGGVLLHP
ncbi:MAG: fasciclin domain-containing protein [Cyclobacteriaceae bacterium]|nr:fasciclin domain-containing protein [Cyclobacteriaceae bacterium]